MIVCPKCYIPTHSQTLAGRLILRDGHCQECRRLVGNAAAHRCWVCEMPRREAALRYMRGLEPHFCGNGEPGNPRRCDNMWLGFVIECIYRDIRTNGLQFVTAKPIASS
jgi:hypothetical protein